METRRGNQNRHAVVVGAGPVGLTAAIAMAQHGIHVDVVESGSADQALAGSRAIFLFVLTTRQWNQILPGMGDAVRREAITIPGYTCYAEGKQVFGLQAGAFRLLGHSLPQAVTHRVLMDHAKAQNITIHLNSAVTDVHTSPDGAEVTLASGRTISAPYLIAADGARSAVRRSLGISLDGHRDQTPFVIVDVAAHPDAPTSEKLGYFHYAAPHFGGRNVMHMPFAGGMRLDIQCLADDDADYFTSAAGLHEWIPQVVDPWYADHVSWVSKYHFNQAVASSYTDPHHRVLLVGEAAHVFAPFGGRGLNSGVFDAADAAHAIDRALRTDSSAAAAAHIRAAASRRRAWGLHNRRVSDRALKRMRAASALEKLKRSAATAAAPWFPPAGVWLANGPTMLTLPRLAPPGLY
jgi:3-(3-hydroxy-phenyl)propionate hydroxylase